MSWHPPKKTAMLVGKNFSISGFGIGAVGITTGEVCFNTAMTGYQEVLSDPSYAGQIITFTFPHIGNVGANDDDSESALSSLQDKRLLGAQGVIMREAITAPANYRAQSHLDAWLKARNIIGITGVDTRAITAYIRENGMFDAVLAHAENGAFDTDAMQVALAGFAGLSGADLASDVSTDKEYGWKEGKWVHHDGFSTPKTFCRVVALDFGIKKNILRCLASVGCEVIVLPATATAEDILAQKPDGIFLSNGPGDPAATAPHIVPTLKALIEKTIPIFGICLGHQILAEALGAKTEKMRQGHHGANHPVKDLTTGKVEIVSMNHGFSVAQDSLPAHIAETHISLFDGTNCGLAVKDKPIFSVQYHPEAAPGPQDSHYLFTRFADAIRASQR